MLAQIAEYVKYPCPNTIGGCEEVIYLIKSYGKETQKKISW